MNPGSALATRRKFISNPRCSVCRHPDRHSVDMAHVAGCGLDAIAAKYGTEAHPLSRSSIHRHVRDHIDESLRAGLIADIPMTELAARAAKEGVGLLDHFALVRSTLVTQMLVAAGVNDGHRVSALAGRTVEVLKEIGRLSGELRDVASHVTINTTTILNMPIFIDLQAMLIERLSDYPEALERVVEGLRELEAREDVGPARLPLATTGRDGGHDARAA